MAEGERHERTLPPVLTDGVASEWVSFEQVEALVDSEEEKSVLRAALDDIAARAEEHIRRAHDLVRRAQEDAALALRSAQESSIRSDMAEERERGLHERIGELRAALAMERSRPWHKKLFG